MLKKSSMNNYLGHTSNHFLSRQYSDNSTRRNCHIFRCIYLDRRLTWRIHKSATRKQLGLKFQKMYWILGRKSEPSIENKLLIYKTYSKAHPGIKYSLLWCTASNSNIAILNRYKNKFLRAILTHWGLATRILVFTLQRCRTGDENPRL
jgi:hypothetical protein